jgi:predicted dienelactone hydrolase
MKRVMIALALAALFAGCATPRQQPPAPAAAAATSTASADAKTLHEDLPVGAIPNALLRDAQRNRDLELVIEYPTRGGLYPVIIFSHGYGGSNRAYTALTEYWTSRGYVCIKPNHADAGRIREALAPVIEERREQRRSRRQEPNPQPTGPPPPDPESIWEGQTENDYRNRVRDITLIIDNLANLETQYPELKGRMDPARVGIGGHSYGALTTMLAAGLKVTKNGAALRLADARMKAGLAMSPQGVAADIGTTSDSWSEVRIPMLYMTGSRDFGVEGQDPTWRRQAYENSPPPDKWLVWIEGATHMTFTGALGALTPQEMDRRQAAVRDAQNRGMDPRGLGVPTRGRGFGTVRIASLAFWDAYLKEDAKAKDRLNGFNSETVKIERK